MMPGRFSQRFLLLSVLFYHLLTPLFDTRKEKQVFNAFFLVLLKIFFLFIFQIFFPRFHFCPAPLNNKLRLPSKRTSTNSYPPLSTEKPLGKWKISRAASISTANNN